VPVELLPRRLLRQILHLLELLRQTGIVPLPSHLLHELGSLTVVRQELETQDLEGGVFGGSGEARSEGGRIEKEGGEEKKS